MAEGTIAVEPVTDADVEAFWSSFWHRTIGEHEYPAFAINRNNPDHEHLLQQMRQALENDRRLVAGRQVASGARGRPGRAS